MKKNLKETIAGQLWSANIRSCTNMNHLHVYQETYRKMKDVLLYKLKTNLKQILTVLRSFISSIAVSV